ncbi:hypothetical protein [Candidatus Entotheonella palauensis]|uniref:hypothetical protein n=1 Tax=Candidatus Entotheonella palauensis TaxID=93172 RepID=UPI000B7C9EC6|nr:hypothetical protein [Candidatus Entotheonella palauensis]
MPAQYSLNADNPSWIQNLGHIMSALLLTMMLSYSATHAQVFDSSSNGFDGALDLSNAEPGNTILFDPATFDPPLDPDRDNIYHFTTITIPEGITVRLTARILDVRPVVWLASDAVQIAGKIDLNGEAGHTHTIDGFPAVAGAGGYGGGSVKGA